MSIFRHSNFGWDYPPGVTGNEPQITGEWRCANCGAVLPEEYDGKPWDGEECPGGCVNEPDPDALRDQQFDREMQDRAAIERGEEP